MGIGKNARGGHQYNPATLHTSLVSWDMVLDTGETSRAQNSGSLI